MAIPMTLRQKQSLFASLVPRLIDHAIDLGYEVTFGDAYRDPRCPYGIAKSLHRQRLAIDLNLFRGGKYLNSTSAHKPLGLFWEGLNPLCRWGGRFNDGNHYSLTHGGIS